MPQILPGDEREFSLQELLSYDGDPLPMYVAYQGIVYDVSDCPHWRTRIHEGEHFPGQDLTRELRMAPHSEGVFNHPDIRIVGQLSK